MELDHLHALENELLVKDRDKSAYKNKTYINHKSTVVGRVYCRVFHIIRKVIFAVYSNNKCEKREK